MFNRYTYILVLKDTVSLPHRCGATVGGIVVLVVVVLGAITTGSHSVDHSCGSLLRMVDHPGVHPYAVCIHICFVN